MSWYQIWNRKQQKRHIRFSRGRLTSSRSLFSNQLTRAKLLRNIAILGLVSTIVGSLVVALAFAWFARTLPQPDKIVRKEGFATKIKDRNEELLYEIFVDQQRTPVKMDQIPDYLKKATVSVEDKNFYAHGGFDPQGILRAVYTNVFTGQKIGGSTLTQQLVKNVLLTSEKTYSRKIKEFLLAVQIESRYNKDEILLMYLNEAPYGGTAWGVATGAQQYFGKDVSDLNLLESAILAGLPQRPSYFAPFGNNPEAYKTRTEHVLKRMREDGHITREQEEQALEELKNHQFTQRLTSIKAPHFVLYVKEKLEEMFGEELVQSGGLQVKTTLDYPLHQEAQEIVTEEVGNVAASGIGNGAALVIDPNTGEILSMVGSKDYFAKDYDGQVNVTMSLRQPGSSIKPVTYLTGLKKNYTPAYMFMDVPTEFPGESVQKPYKPVNYDGNYRGAVQMRFALGSSLNVPAVKMLALVGIEEMLQTAYDLGFVTLEPTKENMNRFGLAVTLGGGEVRLIDMVPAYAALANGGTKTEAVSILEVLDRNGNKLYEHKSVKGKQVVDPGHAFLINHMLSDNNARLLTFGANSYINMGDSVAVKTGTTNDKRDNWTVGWTNTVAVGVWVGNNDNSPMKQVASGVTGASPIWRRIMVRSLKGRPTKGWVVPNNVEAVQVDAVSGYPEHDGFAKRTEYVIKGTLPPLPDPIHTKLKLCKGQSKLASTVDVARGEYEEKEFIVPQEDVKLGTAKSWLDAIKEWATVQGDDKYKFPTDYCDSDKSLIVEIREPEDKKNYDGDEVKVRVNVVSTSEVDRVIISVDDKTRETLVEKPYETTLSLEKGAHVLKAKAILKDGKEATTERKIGTGGVAWDYDPQAITPSPVPTAMPSVSPTP